MFLLKQLPGDATMEAYSRRFPGMDKRVTRDRLAMLQEASFLLRELERLFGAHALSQTRFLILIVLEREGGQLTGSEIRDLIDISRPVLTTTLRGLQKEGYIALSPAPDNARHLLATLSEAGTAKLETVLPEYFALIRDWPDRRTCAASEI